jgi:hypothetical protein
MAARKRKLVDAPMALASDGSLLINVAGSDGPKDTTSLIERAVALGGRVFVGVVATPIEVSATKQWLDVSISEVAATFWGERHRQARRRPR